MYHPTEVARNRLLVALERSLSFKLVKCVLVIMNIV